MVLALREEASKAHRDSKDLTVKVVSLAVERMELGTEY